MTIAAEVLRMILSAGNSRHRASATHAGLIGRIVDVPADVFSVEIPDMYYRGLITKRDYGHKDSFEVKFEEDGSRYWLPIADCQRWLDQMEARGRTELSETIGAASDNFAASVLAGFAGKTFIPAFHVAPRRSSALDHVSQGSLREVVIDVLHLRSSLPTPFPSF